MPYTLGIFILENILSTEKFNQKKNTKRNEYKLIEFLIILPLLVAGC